MKHNIYDAPDINKVTNITKLIFDIYVSILKNYVNINEVKAVVTSNLVGPSYNPRANSIIILA